ncbi:MAG TPA: hypothetical protein VMV69_18715 [Pirellulales bacterium]|nr:hypothetical protein [Pirellulales bacterium]
MSRRKNNRQPSRTEATPPPSKPPTPIAAWQWFLLSAALPLVFLASKLNLDLWEDEIYTITEFVAGGTYRIVTDYSAPNNHVFYSLLLRPFYLIGESSFVLRLPSLACAAGTLWLVFKLARRLAGLPAAIAATVTLGLNLMFLVHAIQVRGYSLSMLLAAWLADLALAEPQARTRARSIAVVLAGAAFLYVLPTNVLFFLPLALLAIVRASRGAASNPQSAIRNPQSKMAIAWFAAVLLAAACYAPIYRQVLEHGEPKDAFSWSGFWLPASVFFTAAGRDVRMLIPLWLAGVCCWAWRVGRRPSANDVAVPLLCLVVVTGSFALSGLLRISPFPRIDTPLLPIVALGAGWSLAELLEAARRRWLAWLPEAVSGVAGLLLVLAVLAPGVVTYPRRLTEACRHERPQDGYFNYYAANYHPSAVVEALSDWTRNDTSYSIVYAKEDHWNLRYYLNRARLAPARPPRGSAAAVYVVAPRAAHWDELAARLGLLERELRGWPLLREFGYYRVFRSPDYTARGQE